MAGGGVPVPDRDQLRLLRAGGRGGRAAGREGAAGAVPGPGRRGAADRGQPLAALLQVGQRREQPGGVGHPRVREHVVGAADLDRLPGVHDQHLVGHARDHAQVVADQDQRRAGLLPDRAEGVKDLGLHGHVQGRGRLVRDEQGGLVRDGDGDDHALAHPAGQLVREAPGELGRLGQADQAQHLDGPLPGGGLADPPVQADALGHLPADGVHRVERGHRVLEDHGRPGPADALPLRRGAAQHLGPVQPDRPADLRGPRQEAQDRQGQHGLPGPGLPDDPDRLARLQGEADAPDGLDGPGLGGNADGQAGDLEQGPAPGGRRAAALPVPAADSRSWHRYLMNSVL
jgi:hypothetical protein